MKQVRDELYQRILLNRLRLSNSIYRSEEIFKESSTWPGDFPGRAILALVSLYNAFDGYSSVKEDILEQLKDIFNHIDEYLNEYSYFGNPFNGSYVDEQQVAGNSWYIRGLIGYYRITKNEKYLKQIESIVKNFLNPISSFYEHYPISKREFGGVAGHITEEIYEGWKLSSDIGCAFIMMDGMSEAYELIKDAQLKTNLEHIIEKFLTIDFVNLECQTHATVSCARGIYRFYQVTNERKYLDYAINIFDKYMDCGMTYDYSNINWFNRPNTWTEPCCIIDSIIIAKKLYLETREYKYLNLFNHIYVNSVRTFQRDNGGAGCSTCAYEDNYKLKVFMYEAFFCCTMRLGEGFKEICDFSVIKESNSIYIPFVTSVYYKDDDFDFIIDNRIYDSGKIHIKVNKAIKNSKLYIYVPRGTLNNNQYYLNNKNFIEVTINDKDSICIQYNLNCYQDNGLNFIGDMLLSKKEEKVENEIIIKGEVYSPIYDNCLFNEKELENKVQYLK